MKKLINFLSSCSCIFFLLFTSSAGASDMASPAPAPDAVYSTRDNLTGDWGGVRTDWHDAGVDIGLNYTAEPAALVSGGYQYDSTYLHNINAELKLDLAKLISIKNTTFLAKYSSRDGDNLSEEYVVPGSAENGRYIYGEYFNKSQEAFGGQTTKLVNFQLTTQFDQFTFDYGRLVMNDLFLRSDLYCNFMNNGICGSPKGVFTPYALSAYPDATVGAHVKWQTGEMVDLKLGVFDGGWTKQNSDGWDWSMGRNGVAVTGEVQIYFDRGAGGGAQKVLKFGANHHTGEFKNFKTGELTDDNTSLWFLVDWILFREQDSASQGLALLGSIVYDTDDEIAGLPTSYTLGFVYEGLIPGRDRDKLGLMAIVAEHSDYNTYTHDYVAGKERGTETVWELTYNFILPYGIQFMPDVQYITNPNGSKDFDDVLVVGTKLSVTF
ncbi:MAG: carbohydrate porin [Deltaproteobacteria bacterium]|nr:carbohydrate porin [Deltaproteobacteria bacterium]